MPPKVLVVDDEEHIRKLLKRFLGDQKYAVIAADNASEALLMAKESRPDLIISDVDMPGMDGDAFCRVLKQSKETKNIPVLLMSGRRVEEKDIVSGYEGGADDYVLKPFSLPVMSAKIQAVLRRYETSVQMGERLKKCGIELDPAGRTVKVGGKGVSLTRKEFDLLATLLERCGRVLSVNNLLESVWGYDPAEYNDPTTVEVHVSHLRKKLGPKAAKHIINVPGHGYKFEEKP